MGRGRGIRVVDVGAVAFVAFAVACGGDARWDPPPVASVGVLTDADRVFTIEGLSGPEAVRYDPDQDVWFVGNMNGGAGERDGNGFVARVSAATGDLETLRFVMGDSAAPLHAPRGMTIVADTLWVTDIDGVHGFDRRTGEHRAFVDLSSFHPGFLNDVARGSDGALYVTDTGRSVVYRVEGRRASEATWSGSDLGSPNGITLDPARGALVTVPWGPGGRVRAWGADGASRPLGPRSTPGRLDGVEPLDGALLVASQSDSTLYLLDESRLRPMVRVPGAPADIGIDTARRRVAVPYIALDRVDVWALPAG